MSVWLRRLANIQSTPFPNLSNTTDLCFLIGLPIWAFIERICRTSYISAPFFSLQQESVFTRSGQLTYLNWRCSARELADDALSALQLLSSASGILEFTIATSNFSYFTALHRICELTQNHRAVKRPTWKWYKPGSIDNSVSHCIFPQRATRKIR